jgi:SAM-dependent methyltransferase
MGATDYSEYWATLRVSHAAHPANLFRYELIAAELKKLQIKPARVVDCGCGDGSLLATVRRTIPCGQLHGMDIARNVPASAPGMLDQFCQQDLGEPIPETERGRYDLAVCSEVIEHVPNDQRVIENVSNLLAPQGWLVLTTQTGNIYKTEQFLGHLRHYHLDELCDRLTKAGFRIVRAYRSGWPFLNMQKIAAHILQDTVQKKVVTAPRLSLPVRILFAILHRLYWFTLRSYGPQLMIVAQKT